MTARESIEEQARHIRRTLRLTAVALVAVAAVGVYLTARSSSAFAIRNGLTLVGVGAVFWMRRYRKEELAAIRCPW